MGARPGHAPPGALLWTHGALHPAHGPAVLVDRPRLPSGTAAPGTRTRWPRRRRDSSSPTSEGAFSSGRASSRASRLRSQISDRFESLPGQLWDERAETRHDEVLVLDEKVFSVESDEPGAGPQDRLFPLILGLVCAHPFVFLSPVELDDRLDRTVGGVHQPSEVGEVLTALRRDVHLKNRGGEPCRHREAPKSGFPGRLRQRIGPRKDLPGLSPSSAWTSRLEMVQPPGTDARRRDGQLASSTPVGRGEQTKRAVCDGESPVHGQCTHAIDDRPVDTRHAKAARLRHIFGGQRAVVPREFWAHGAAVGSEPLRHVDPLVTHRPPETVHGSGRYVTQHRLVAQSVGRRQASCEMAASERAPVSRAVCGFVGPVLDREVCPSLDSFELTLRARAGEVVPADVRREQHVHILGLQRSHDRSLPPRRPPPGLARGRVDDGGPPTPAVDNRAPPNPAAPRARTGTFTGRNRLFERRNRVKAPVRGLWASLV